MQQLNTIPLVKIPDLIAKAQLEGNQDMVNNLAFEAACRLFIPGMPIDKLNETATQLGYKEIDLVKEKQKTRTK